MMSEEAKQRIQIALALAIAIAGIRAGYVLYRRHEDNVAAQKQQAAKNAGYSNADYSSAVGDSCADYDSAGPGRIGRSGFVRGATTLEGSLKTASHGCGSQSALSLN